MPQGITVKEIMLKYAKVQATKKWAFNTYSGNINLMENHIFPYIGDREIQKLTPYEIEDLLSKLRKVHVKGPKSYNRPEEEIPFLSSTTVRHVYTLLSSAFDKAVEWKMLKENPVVCEAPKKNKVETEIWAPEEIMIALERMEKKEHAILHLAVHMAFVGSMRNGETMALTQDCIDFNKNRIKISKTMQRVKRKALEAMPKGDLIFVFPEKNPNSNSVLILKKTKTDSSERYVFMTKPLKEELLKCMKEIERQKAYYGENYHDFHLIFCLDNGDPIEPKLLEKRFKKWQKRYSEDLPEIKFHGLRHSSITYKLYVSGGDIKVVQGDSGHATAAMVTDKYAHMQDSRRFALSQKLEESFYSPEIADELDADGGDEGFLMSLANQLQKNPEALNKLLAALDAPKR